MKLEPLSAAEWKVMKIIWELGPCAARDVYTIAQKKHNWQPGTTKTLIRRLVDKKRLVTKQIGNSYLYTPTSSMLDELCEATEGLLADTSEGTAASLMLNMVKRGKIGRKDIQELRSMLERIEAS